MVTCLDFMNDVEILRGLGSISTLPDQPQDQQDMLDGLFQGEINLEECSERVDDLMKAPYPVPALNLCYFVFP
ncbi:hypothetical protein BGZ90_003573 [Linnemannia elongata]|nr:hypothetical protein BGZ90_003573 [Linnemannia elongata]